MEATGFIDMDPALFRLECVMASDPIASMLAPFYAALCLLLFVLVISVIMFYLPTQPEELKATVSEYLSSFQRYRRRHIDWSLRHPGKPKAWQLFLCLDFRDKMLALFTVRSRVRASDYAIARYFQMRVATRYSPTLAFSLEPDNTSATSPNTVLEHWLF